MAILGPPKKELKLRPVGQEVCQKKSEKFE